MGGEYAIDLRNVTKIYKGRVEALRGISMQVHRGEIFGLLGPNGAGKSTLVKIMVTVVRPTRAEGTILGHDIGHKRTLGRVGYLPENHRFPRYLTGRQVVEFFSALANVRRAQRRKRAAELLDQVGMTQWAEEKISKYSKGMLQRVGLAQAMGNSPDLVILDEPTDGVDPAGRRDIREVLRNLREQGVTVFINSHLLGELEALCDRMAILVQGQVARQGSVSELTGTRHWYIFEFDSPGVWNSLRGVFPGVFTDGPPPLPAMPAKGNLPSGAWCDFDGTTLRVGIANAGEVQPVLDALRRHGLVVRRLQLIHPSLEDLFFEAVADPGTQRSFAVGAAGGAAGRPG
jgi:ABC-2 type transport system ATP-binding protein